MHDWVPVGATYLCGQRGGYYYYLIEKVGEHDWAQAVGSFHLLRATSAWTRENDPLLTCAFYVCWILLLLFDFTEEKKIKKT